MPGRHRSVLVVDPSPTVRRELAEAFDAAGFEPLSCSTDADARVLLSHRSVDAIVLDGDVMDGEDGGWVRELLSTRPGPAPAVVVLSGDADVSARPSGHLTGVDDYVARPYEPRQLVARVRQVLAGRTPADTTSVLVIDDSPAFRRALRAACASAGYSVLEASTGEQGLQVAATRRPDAVVVNGVLPGIDGGTVIRRLRLDAVLRDLPCLLLVHGGGPNLELWALDAGADAFVRREEDLDLILARLHAMVRSAPARPRASDEALTLVGVKRILAVDSNPHYLDGLSDALREEGYDVIPARAGDESLELLAVQPVDCILMELQLPGLSAYETCSRIKAAPGLRHIPLIVLTALGGKEAMIQALSAGADDFIPKSTDLQVLKARVRAKLRRKQFEDESRRIREELLRKQREATEARAARELAETRAMLVEELERKNRELEAFSYSVSHDLRAPLRAIDGFSRIVLEDYGPSIDPKGREYLERVCAAAERMGELIDDLLALSRVGRAELHWGHVDLSHMAREVVAELCRRSGRTVDVTIGDALSVEGDSRLMRIVLENLLGNSWKFTANRPDASITLGCDSSGPEPVYFVRDNGAGFEMAYADKLFRPFQRLHTETEFTGTGIGLATVHRIIDRHGGRIWAEGAVGRGATFSFTIPAGRHKGAL